MKKSYIVLLSALLGFSSCKEQKPADILIVPQPVSVIPAQGVFTIKSSTPIRISADTEEMRSVANYINLLLSKSLGGNMPVELGVGKDGINISTDANMPSEAYKLDVKEGAVQITAGSPRAAFYAVQTLRQMLPTAIEKGEQASSFVVACATIEDEPRFTHRGAMLDVGRHIFSVDEVKTFIDMLAMHKLNTFHWHLTEDQGWRIEIKKYPELTKVGSMRSGTIISGGDKKEYDDKPYGGFYTQEEVKDIVKYAQDRFVTIIPEIEMPGHGVAALASYPWLGCTGGPYEVRKEWGVATEVYCAGSERTFEFLQDVLTEVFALFPSEYIHIGGDECPKDAWKKCPKCQKRIRDNKLKDEYELQSYVIKRMEAFINANGKKMIGWDEILEGGLAKTATVMSWQGVHGGIEAARHGNEVIMSPNSHVYLDFYQSMDRAAEPIAIGGFTDVEKVYSYEPVPSELTADEAKLIRGVQGNIWTEYMPTFSQVQYMALPRIAALAEVAWTKPELKKYSEFVTRVTPMVERYKNLGYNYADHIFSVRGEAVPTEGAKTLTLTLSSVTKGDICYTTDGSEPTATSTLYTAPITVSGNEQVRALCFVDGQPAGRVYRQDFFVSKAAFQTAELQSKTSTGYHAKGIETLTDGIKGKEAFNDGKWIGTQQDDVVALIDFGTETAFNTAKVGALQEINSWIMIPNAVKVYTSNDGKEFALAGELNNIPTLEGMMKNGLKHLEVKFDEQKARFAKVVVERSKFLPEPDGSQKRPSYLFVDEVEIY